MQFIYLYCVDIRPNHRSGHPLKLKGLLEK